MSLINLLSRLLQHMSVTPRVVHYLCGTEALPTPFTAEEEADALARFAAGDNEARDTLVERNLRLVVFLSKKYESTGIDMEDIVSVGTIGLIKEINSFSHVIYGEMYLVSFVIDGDEYLAVKYVNRSDKEGCLKLVSYNPHHEPMDVPLAAINAMAIVKFSIRKNMMM